MLLLSRIGLYLSIVIISDLITLSFILFVLLLFVVVDKKRIKKSGRRLGRDEEG